VLKIHEKASIKVLKIHEKASIKVLKMHEKAVNYKLTINKGLERG